jgi:hypothetical protein
LHRLLFSATSKLVQLRETTNGTTTQNVPSLHHGNARIQFEEMVDVPYTYSLSDHDETSEASYAYHTLWMICERDTGELPNITVTLHFANQKFIGAMCFAPVEPTPEQITALAWTAFKQLHDVVGV